MDSEPIRDPRIIEAMEACRPGSDDVADPDMAFLAAYLAASPELDKTYERLQSLDASVAKAFQEVLVPEGLAERLLDQLRRAAAQSASGLPAETGRPQDDVETLDEPAVVAASRPSCVSRRWMLVGVASLGLAGSLLVAVVLQSARTVYSEAQVLEMAIRFFDTESPAPAEGHLVVHTPPPKAFPISPLVFQHAQVRWRLVAEFLGQSGVAYDLTRPGGARATLYVTRQTATGTPDSPPSRPWTTHNRSVSTWQSGSLLYVLVVDGGPQTYRSYLDIPRGPVANWSHKGKVAA